MGEPFYHRYFENPFGEQWVFVYDHATKQGALRGGDVGWEQVFPVVDGHVESVILDSAEIQWLRAGMLGSGNRREKDEIVVHAG